MEKSYLLDFLKKQGFEVIEKKTVTQITFQKMVSISISASSKRKVVSFPLFKKEDNGVRSTHKHNKQRDKFIEVAKDVEDLDYETKPAPFFTCSDFSELKEFIVDYDVVDLIKEYVEFPELSSECVIGTKEKDGKILSFRSNVKTEEEIVRDVFIHSEYQRRGLVVNKEDVVLDLGGNIGCFTMDVFDKVKKVITFEPEPVNFAILSSNLETNKVKNVTSFNHAVVGNADKTRDLFCGKVPYYYSFLVKNNRKAVPVVCQNINNIMKKYKPTKMKVDIEGSEWEVLTNCTNFYGVTQLVFEYNFDMNKDLKTDFEHFDKLTKHLAKHGFDVSELKNYSRSKSWADVFLANRK